MLRTICQTRIHNKSLQQTLISPFLRISSSYASLSSKNQNSNKDKVVDPNDAVTLFNRDPDDPPRLFLVQPRLTPPVFLQAKLNEALCLANSLEEQRDGYFNTDFFDKELPPHVVVQNPALKLGKARADTYFGPGTVETIKCHLNTVESKDEVDAVYVNAILSGVQQRNLERAWGKPVLDRVGLIIEIFNAHAHTKEAKLQAELAALEYKKSRLVRVRGLDGRYTFGAAGEAEVVSARGRGSGGRGFISGAGETELQLQRRRILERRSRLLSQIEEVRRTRAVQRAARRRYGGTHGQALVTVAVVGYTNAGKSTLVSALSDSDLYSDARLFATLDPRLKSVILPSGRKVLFSDTVGFISDLPLQLVDAFHATLEEVVEADLLVHVTDCTAPNLEEHRSTVLQVLRQVGVSEEKLQNMVEVYNKIDYHNEEMSSSEYLEDSEDAKFELIDAEAIDDRHSSDEARENNNDVSKSLSGDLGETLKKDGSEYSDGWLISGEEEENMDELWSTSDDKQNDLTNNDGRQMEEEEEKLECKEGRGPDVKVSALTGVGLQQLLEIIDDRLKIQDDKQKAARVVEKDFFNRKWRPPRNEEASVVVEQEV